MRAQVSFEIMLWLLVSIAFLSTSVAFSYQALHRWDAGAYAALYQNTTIVANQSVQPYSEFGIRIDQNVT